MRQYPKHFDFMLDIIRQKNWRIYSIKMEK
jgi:hypothetical protein